MDKNTEDFYNRLRDQLEKDTTWPSSYLYKFIIPANLESIAHIRVIFDKTDAEITTRDSSSGKFTSISIKTTMESPDAVIEKYLEVSKIDGVISL